MKKLRKKGFSQFVFTKYGRNIEEIRLEIAIKTFLANASPAVAWRRADEFVASIRERLGYEAEVTDQ